MNDTKQKPKVDGMTIGMVIFLGIVVGIPVLQGLWQDREAIVLVLATIGVIVIVGKWINKWN